MTIVGATKKASDSSDSSEDSSSEEGKYTLSMCFLCVSVCLTTADKGAISFFVQQHMLEFYYIVDCHFM